MSRVINRRRSPNISSQRTAPCGLAAEAWSFGVGSGVRWLLILVVVVAGSVPVAFGAGASGSAVALIEAKPANLGWAGIWLGATRREVQTVLRRTIEPMFDENTMACGEFRSKLFVDGHSVEIQWSSKELNGRVDSLAVPLSPNDVNQGGAALVRRLVRRLPILRLLKSGQSGSVPTDIFELAPSGRSSPEILLKAGAENIVFVSSEGCLD